MTRPLSSLSDLEVVLLLCLLPVIVPAIGIGAMALAVRRAWA